MLDRRSFLKASIATSAVAALPGAATAAPALASIEGAIVETLDHLSDLHPAFAYFAGLPGNLGMPFAQRMDWAWTPTAKRAFAHLQQLCNVTCLIVGSSDVRDGTSGLNAAVLRALGPTSTICVAPYGTTVALVMPVATWTALPASTRTALTRAAAGMVRGAQHRFAPRQDTIPTDVEKISEAVVASIATHDALTQRINASYFAYHNAAAASRPKNGV